LFSVLLFPAGVGHAFSLAKRANGTTGSHRVSIVWRWAAL